MSAKLFITLIQVFFLVIVGSVALNFASKAVDSALQVQAGLYKARRAVINESIYLMQTGYVVSGNSSNTYR